MNGLEIGKSYQNMYGAFDGATFIMGEQGLVRFTMDQNAEPKNFAPLEDYDPMEWTEVGAGQSYENGLTVNYKLEDGSISPTGLAIYNYGQMKVQMSTGLEYSLSVYGKDKKEN